MSREQQARWEKATATTLLELPYLAHIALRFRHRPTNAVRTVAVGADLTLYANEKWLSGLADSQLPFVVEHECGHILRRHFLRRDGRSTDRWNIAGDMVINERAVFRPLPSAVMPNKPGMLTEEQYYAGLNEPSGDTCSGGSGAGKPLPIEGDAAYATDAADAAEAARGAIVAAARTSPRAQSLASELGIADEKPPPIDWRVLLRRCLCESAGDGRVGSYARARDYGGVIVPRARRAGIRLRVLADCSGSVDEAALAQILAVVRSSPIAEDCEVAWGTTSVVARQSVRSARPPGITGDTDMAACAAELPPGPLLLITDGLTPWPDRPCWVVLVGGKNTTVPEPCTLIGTVGAT